MRQGGGRHAGHTTTATTVPATKACTHFLTNQHLRSLILCLHTCRLVQPAAGSSPAQHTEPQPSHLTHPTHSLVSKLIKAIVSGLALAAARHAAIVAIWQQCGHGFQCDPFLSKNVVVRGSSLTPPSVRLESGGGYELQKKRARQEWLG